MTLAAAVRAVPDRLRARSRRSPPAVRKRALRARARAAGLGYDAVHLDAIDELVLRRRAGERAVDVPGGRVVRSYDALDLDAGRARRSPTSSRPTPATSCGSGAPGIG